MTVTFVVIQSFKVHKPLPVIIHKIGGRTKAVPIFHCISNDLILMGITGDEMLFIRPLRIFSLSCIHRAFFFTPQYILKYTLDHMVLSNFKFQCLRYGCNCSSFPIPLLYWREQENMIEMMRDCNF